VAHSSDSQFTACNSETINQSKKGRRRRRRREEEEGEGEECVKVNNNIVDKM
jgi:hypothetical protein